MKQKTARIAAAVMLLAALTACGDGTAKDEKKGSIADPDLSVSDKQETDPATGTRYTGEVSDRVVRYGNGYGNTNADKSLHTPTALPGGTSDVAGTARDAVKDGTASTAKTAESTNYQRMLENARVHDSDGFLLDGENSTNRTLP